MKQNSKYNHAFSVAERKTVYLDADDPRASKTSLNNYRNSVGANVVVKSSTQQSDIVLEDYILDASWVVSFRQASLNVSDPAAWFEITMPGGGFLRGTGIVYGNNMFVSVAKSISYPYKTDIAAYSTSGGTWIESTMPSVQLWQDVAYGDGTFVAISTSIDAAYSTDGISWTLTAMPSTGSWRSVTYGNGIFVAIAAASGLAAYSTDGITWTASTMPGSYTWTCISYGNGTFVAINGHSSDSSAYSVDGISWTSTTLPRPDAYTVGWSSIAYGNGTFVVVSLENSGGYSPVVYSTDDGATWTLLNMPVRAEWTAIAYGNGKFVATGIHYPDPYVALSVDGITWTYYAPTSGGGTAEIGLYGHLIANDAPVI